MAAGGKISNYRDWLALVNTVVKDRKMPKIANIHCRLCRGVGHMSQNCPSNARSIARASNSNKRTHADVYEDVKKEKVTVDTAATPAARKKGCYQCGDLTHYARDCKILSKEVQLRMGVTGDQYCYDPIDGSTSDDDARAYF